MASLVLSGDTSGSITVSAPAVSGSNTQTLAAVTGTLAPIVSATAKASTSGTSVDFTDIPSWVKRITVMLSGVSTNGTSGIRFQLMVGGVAVTSSYTAANVGITNAITAAPSTVTNGFPLSVISASSVNHGQIILSQLSSTVWTASGTFYDNLATERMYIIAGRVTSLSGAVDGIRVTTAGGTDTFDAGTINILYE